MIAVGMTGRERRAWGIYAALWAGLHTIVFFADPALNLLVINHEELASGNLARGLIEGLITNPWHYQYASHSHGTLVYGLLLTPFYALFGSSLVWIKALGLAFAAAGTALWVIFVRRGLGATAAWLFAVWWLLPPIGLIRIQHLAWANHMESIALVGALFVFYQSRAESAPRTAFYAALGFAAGLATFFCLQVAVGVAALAAVDTARRRGPALARWALAATPAFLVAFSPHWLYLSATGRRLTLTAGSWQGAERLTMLFGRVVPSLFRYEWMPVTILALALAAAGIVAALPALSGRATRRQTQEDAWCAPLLLLTVGGFVAAYCTSSFLISAADGDIYNYRYAVPYLPALMALAARALTRWPRPAAALVMVPLALGSIHDARWPAQIVSVITQARSVGPAGSVRRMRGDDMGGYIAINAAYAWNEDVRLSADKAAAWTRVFDQVDRLPAFWRPYALEELGLVIGDAVLPAADARGLSAADRRAILTGLSRKTLLDRANADAQGEITTIEPAPESAAATNTEDRTAWYEGEVRAFFANLEGRHGYRFRQEDIDATRAAIANVQPAAGVDPDELRAGWLLGLGHTLGEYEIDLPANEAVGLYSPYEPTPANAELVESGRRAGLAIEHERRYRW